MSTDITPTPTALDKVKESAKAVATLVGTIVTGLLVVLVDNPSYAAPLAIVGAIATAVATWATSNAETPQQKAVRQAGEEALLPADGYPDGYEKAVVDVDSGAEVDTIDARDLS